MRKITGEEGTRMRYEIEGLVVAANRVINSLEVDNIFKHVDYDLSEGLKSEFKKSNIKWTAVLMSVLALKLRANNSWGDYALRVSKAYPEGFPAENPQELFEEIYSDLLRQNSFSKEINIPYKRYTTIWENKGDFTEIPKKYFDDGNIVKIEDGRIKATITYVEHRFVVFIDNSQEFIPENTKHVITRHEIMPGNKDVVMNLPLKKNESGKFYIPTEINLWDIELEEVFDTMFDGK